jgi:hypothetical protein
VLLRTKCTELKVGELITGYTNQQTSTCQIYAYFQMSADIGGYCWTGKYGNKEEYYVLFYS